jgi:hypothetical protein
MKLPESQEFGSYYAEYISEVPPGHIVDILRAQGETTALFLAKINEHTSRHRYAEGKWSIREIAGHLADAERVFAYRALRFARADSTPLPGFDENEYVVQSGADLIPLAEHAWDLQTIRKATLTLFQRLTADQARYIGTASGSPFSPRALAYIIAGHELHHLNVIRDRYLS